MSLGMSAAAFGDRHATRGIRGPITKASSSAVETRNQRDNRGYLGCWVVQAYCTARAVKLIRLLPRTRLLADPGDGISHRAASVKRPAGPAERERTWTLENLLPGRWMGHSETYVRACVGSITPPTNEPLSIGGITWSQGLGSVGSKCVYPPLIITVVSLAAVRKADSAAGTHPLRRVGVSFVCTTKGGKRSPSLLGRRFERQRPPRKRLTSS